MLRFASKIYKIKEVYLYIVVNGLTVNLTVICPLSSLSLL